MPPFLAREASTLLSGVVLALFIATALLGCAIATKGF